MLPARQRTLGSSTAACCRNTVTAYRIIGSILIEGSGFFRARETSGGHLRCRMGSQALGPREGHKMVSARHRTLRSSMAACGFSMALGLGVWPHRFDSG